MTTKAIKTTGNNTAAKSDLLKMEPNLFPRSLLANTRSQMNPTNDENAITIPMTNVVNTCSSIMVGAMYDITPSPSISRDKSTAYIAMVFLFAKENDNLIHPC